MKVLVVTNMYPTKERPSFGTFVKDQVAALRAAGVEIDVFFFNGRRSKAEYLMALPHLWWHLLRHRYDLIHAHYVLAGVIARAQIGHKVVLTHHGGEALGHQPFQAKLCRWLTPLCDESIHVSEQIRVALGDDDGWVIPCGVDLDRFTPLPRDEARRQLGLPLDKRLVLFAGEHWRPEKQFWIVKAAIARVQELLPDAELVLLTGKPHETVPAYMAACDALVLTSSFEGSPMVVKEAMAMNLPVVGVRVGDVPEVIGETPGCALAERDPADVANKLVAVLRRPRRTDGRARIEHVRHDRIAQRIIEVYQKAVQPRQKVRQRTIEQGEGR
jgi:teichuronic acid biosynthesis glycosyltransferase TuaC